MGTKVNPGKFDCYQNAFPDEELFVLLARDPHASALVELWALLREIDGEDVAIVAEARACAVRLFKQSSKDFVKRPLDFFQFVQLLLNVFRHQELFFKLLRELPHRYGEQAHG